eukprot:scaffold42699_cov33-Tisochrysis_lutea.AAC.1
MPSRGGSRVISSTSSSSFVRSPTLTCRLIVDRVAMCLLHTGVECAINFTARCGGTCSHDRGSELLGSRGTTQLHIVVHDAFVVPCAPPLGNKKPPRCHPRERYLHSAAVMIVSPPYQSPDLSRSCAQDALRI